MTDRLTRRNHGKGHSYLIDGEPVRGVTTIIRNGIPKDKLVGWAARVTAAHAVDHWDELAELTPSKRLYELEQARWNTQNAAAARGSAVHDYAAKLAGGEEVEIPEATLPLVDAYLSFIADYKVVELAVEAPVAYFGNDPLHRDRYAGTLDLVARLEIFGEDDVSLIDWKTGDKGIFPEVALQLAAYARADVIHIAGVEHPMFPVKRALAVWLRSDGYDVYPIDISASTFRTFQYAQQVAFFTTGEREEYIGEALARPVDEEVAS